MSRVFLSIFVLAAFASTAFAQDESPLKLVGDVANGAIVAEGCFGCHGADGHTSRANTPHLAGQYEEYLKRQLWLFQTGQRTSRPMNRVVEELSAQDLADVAAYWADRPAKAVSTSTDGLVSMYVLLGSEFYAAGGGGVSACSRCHGDLGQGNPERNIPRVTGFGAEYVANALLRYRAGGVDDMTSMHRVASRLTDTDIEVLSDFLASQPWWQETEEEEAN